MKRLITVNLDEKVLMGIEEYRKKFNPIPNRSKAVEDLLKKALTSQ